MKALLLLLAWLAPLTVTAHALAPALLDVRETTAGHYDVTWRTSVVRVQGVDVSPRFGEGCREGAAGPPELIEGTAVATRWTLACEGGLAGTTVSIDGLGRSGINAVVRIALAGAPAVEHLLDAGEPAFVVPAPGRGAGILGPFFRLGVEHLATGLDHLLFVIGLVILVGRTRPVLVAVTGFTLGHSATLALATLGAIRIEPRIAELGIALTLLALASEIARPAGASRTWMSARPGIMATLFGLVHGLGFAGALAAIGLPAGGLAPALLGFNLGIEGGQLIVVAILLGAGGVARRVRTVTSAPLARALPAYAIGTLAAYFSLHRAVEWLT